jgi:glycerophosphoryl diester phosphodiesterase
MTPLPPAFLVAPLAHRGLHGPGRAENSLEAFEAAAEAGYGIELDVQLTADGQAVVFHDAQLGRMTGERGPVAARTLAELRALPLQGGGTIPGLDEVLETVRGQVPVLVEIKDQSGVLGPVDERLETAVAKAVGRHPQNVAVMSFNPRSILALRDLAPEIPRGLTTEDFTADEWPGVPRATLERLTEIPYYDACGAAFVSHHHRHLGACRIAELKAAGAAILCWTIRSAAEEREARKIADNITFEGYDAPRGAA